MLTGKDIHAAFKQHDNHAKKWEEVSEYGRAAYEAVAEILNDAHIAPLQGLVETLQRNEQATFKDALSIIGATVTDSVTTISDLQIQITALQGLVKELEGLVDWDNFTEAYEEDTLKRIKQLCGEEPKS